MDYTGCMTSASGIFEAWGPPGPAIPPSMLVRRWDSGLVAFVLAAGVIGALCAWPFVGHGIGLALSDVCWALLGDESARERLSGEWPMALAVLGPALVAGIGSALVALKPRRNRWHVGGVQLLEGKAATLVARSRSCKADEPFAMTLHPDLRLDKRVWSQHVFVFGGVGAGKSVIMGSWLDQVIQNKWKCLIYDVKGDLTARYREPIILSPYDRRSWVWDIARDVRSAGDADILAEHLAPAKSGESNPFFTQGTQMILGALIRMLQAEKGTTWTWGDLRDACLLPLDVKKGIITAHHPMAALVLNDPKSKSASDLQATLGTVARLVSDLALAWPESLAEYKGRSRRFSVRDWAQDSYTGRPQVIVQGGGPAQLTSMYIGALINIASSIICAGTLPDNEGGRFLGFFLDELADMTRGGPIDTRLWSLGRAKGVVVCAATQAPEQLESNLGKENAEALLTLSRTTIYARMGSGASRDRLADRAGHHRVASITDGRVAEDFVRVLTPTDLTSGLGVDMRTRTVGAIVDQGGDLLHLRWPLMDYPKVRPGVVPGVLLKPERVRRKTPPSAEVSIDEVRGRLGSGKR
ncbi:MAG: hypothetical protein EPN58_11275 [Rhodanobacter sp.]|nr:MAG: hypothetical protein EPN58_11275 [Rhodanobacter sp.]